MAAGRKPLLLLPARAAAKQGRSVWALHARSFCSLLESHNLASHTQHPSSNSVLHGSQNLDVTLSRSPLFLSSLSSILSQSATPFYCPRDVRVVPIYGNFCSHEVKPQSKHDVDHAAQPLEAETGCETPLDLRGSKEELRRKHQSSRSNNGLINWSNAISFARLLSGPYLSWLIAQGLTQPALVGLVIAGASDWLDGYIARRNGEESVFGTYLDPLADKVLIGCVAFSMAHAGYLPSALVILVIARDATLVGGSFIHRARSMNWQISSLKDFFNVMDGGAQKMKPLYISKINTVFQLALVGAALMQPAFGLEDTYSLVPFLSWCVAFTTCASSVGYGWKFLRSSRGSL